MAESQVLYSYDNEVQVKDLEKSFSKKRFTPYFVKAGHDQAYAFNLYLYNARLSKAFLFPLHMLEVTLRNKINEIFKQRFNAEENNGSEWIDNPSFYSLLSKESLDSLNKAKERTSVKNANKKKKLDNLVSEMSFDFWSNLFRDEYDRTLWQTSMSKLLPNSPTTTRDEFQIIIRDINRFRNRIAHHESITIRNVDLSKIHADILKILEGICHSTRDWTKHYSTVNPTIRTRPNNNGNIKPFFGDRCDKNFEAVKIDTTLANCPNKPFLLCVDDDKELISVLEYNDICNFIVSNKDQDDSLIVDLTEFSIKDVIAYSNSKDNFQIFNKDESLSKVIPLFRDTTIKFAVVAKNIDTFIGVIAKAHRIYTS
jgi:hypothetical protein